MTWWSIQVEMLAVTISIQVVNGFAQENQVVIYIQISTNMSRMTRDNKREQAKRKTDSS